MIRSFFVAMNSTSGYIRDGLRQRVNADAILTKLPLVEARWLSLSVPKSAHISAFSDSRRQRARSLPKWNWPFLPTTASLKSSFRIRPRSASILSRASWFIPNSQTGKLETTNPSNAGKPFTADRLAPENFSNIKTEPAERRVSYQGYNGERYGCMDTDRLCTYQERAQNTNGVL